MTPEQEHLLRDKLEVWRRQAKEGLVDYRDYNRRAVEALEALFALALAPPAQDSEGGGWRPDREAIARMSKFADGAYLVDVYPGNVGALDGLRADVRAILALPPAPAPIQPQGEEQ